MVKEIINKVKLVLTEHEDARDDDSILYMYVMREYSEDAYNGSFKAVMKSIKTTGLPSYESVSRARRFCQAYCPTLRASDNTEAARELEEERYREAYGKLHH